MSDLANRNHEWRSLFRWRSLVASDAFDLTPSRRLVALVLSLRMDRLGHCWPSIARICEESGLSNRTVIDALTDLEDRGWIRVTRQNGGRGGRKAVNHYTMAFPKRMPHLVAT